MMVMESYTTMDPHPSQYLVEEITTNNWLPRHIKCEVVAVVMLSLPEEWMHDYSAGGCVPPIGMDTGLQ